MSLIIANWKMNLSLAESAEFCRAVSSQDYKNLLVICPPAPYLAYLASQFPLLSFGAQHISHLQNYGAYTGEYSAQIIKNCQVNYALIGHSDRQQLFSESNAQIKQQAINCLKVGICPIICLGESLQIRQSGDYQAFIMQQLAESVPVTEQPVIIAYEPIWSISTGSVPSRAQLTEITQIINAALQQRPVANNASLVYGGSVNLTNLASILGLADITGVLVGQASLNYQTLIPMLNY